MNDPIDRQDAIDAIKNQTCLTYEEIFNRCLVSTKDENGWLGGIKSAIEALIDLPSVQPDLDEWCTDCKEYDQERHCCPRWNKVIRETLKDLKPEIIRCKDCRYYQDNNGGYPHMNCKWDANETPDEDDFCSGAERRTDDT